MIAAAPLIVGNWKMNGVLADVAEARFLGHVLVDHPTAARVVVCPPATLLAMVSRALEDSVAATGGQDCHAELRGAFTGGVSASMLADAGARYVLLGHSERRWLEGETSAAVARKAAAAVAAGLVPIICAGESLATRRAGRAQQMLGRLLRASLPEALARHDFAVAYEPVWAIGSGRLPEPEEIRAAHALIRALLVERFDERGRDAPILYGGSVTGDNAGRLLCIEGVDGLLVGGASLSAADFLPIVRAADSLRPPEPRRVGARAPTGAAAR